MKSVLRILYVPNESGEFRQLGFRRPFANLLDAGLVDEVSVFSLQWRIRNGGDAEQHRQDLIQRVRDFQPNLVLMQHLGSTGLQDRHFKEMRRAADFRFVYHEGDPYSRFLHPLPQPARSAGKFSDVVFTVGSGVFRQNFVRAGAGDVRWAPSAFEPERYRHRKPDPATRRFDVVVVANRNMPRFRGHPNWKDRIAFVNHLEERFGDRLAIYGHGWRGPSAMGPVSPDLQDEAIRSGWVSANWDHYAGEASYFSNRLPISLAAGSIHATTEHPGYSDLFPSQRTGEFLIYRKSSRELGETIEKVLSETTESERLAACGMSQQFVSRYFRQDDQLLSFLNYRTELVGYGEAKSSWNVDATPLNEM